MLRVTCTNCHMPFIINRDALQAALDEVDREGYKHFNAYCSNCGRPNKLSKKQLMRSAPWWKASANKKAAKPAKANKSKDGKVGSSKKSSVKQASNAKSDSKSKATAKKAPAKKAPAKTSTSKASTKKKPPAKSKTKK